MNKAYIFPAKIFYRQDNETQGASLAEEDQDLLNAGEPCIMCIFCGTVITSPAERTEIDGSHSHTFLNPSGFVFHIGCFSCAPGCLSQGEMTNEYSWFRNYRWNYAICSGCSHHLGWHYSAGNTHFFGLILDYLVEGT